MLITCLSIIYKPGYYIPEGGSQDKDKHTHTHAHIHRHSSHIEPRPLQKGITPAKTLHNIKSIPVENILVTFVSIFVKEQYGK